MCIKKCTKLGLESNRSWATDPTNAESYVKVLPKIWKMVRKKSLLPCSVQFFSTYTILCMFSTTGNIQFGIQGGIATTIPLLRSDVKEISCHWPSWSYNTQTELRPLNWRYVGRLIHLHPSLCSPNHRALSEMRDFNQAVWYQQRKIFI